MLLLTRISEVRYRHSKLMTAYALFSRSFESEETMVQGEITCLAPIRSFVVSHASLTPRPDLQPNMTAMQVPMKKI